MNGLLIGEVAREHRKELVREADRRRLEQKLRRARTSQTAWPQRAKAGEQAERNIEIRWGLAEDEPAIMKLMDLNGTPRRTVCEEQFVVAEEDGQLLAAMGYQTESKRLVLRSLIADPWAGERDLAVALYAGAGDLAHELGAREVRARAAGSTTYPREAGYRRKIGGWRLNATPSRKNG